VKSRSTRLEKLILVFQFLRVKDMFMLKVAPPHELKVPPRLILKSKPPRSYLNEMSTITNNGNFLDKDFLGFLKR